MFLVPKSKLDKKLKEKVNMIMSRKEEHIDICLNNNVAFEQKTLFECIKILNNPIPEIDFEDIDTSVSFLGHHFSAPIMVGAMTGGAERAKLINKNIALAIEQLDLGMVVGSQRAALYHKVLEDTYTIARKMAPNAFIGSNIGGAQISAGFSINDVNRLIEMLDADAHYVHLNPSQELVQPEGEPKYRNVLKGIRNIVDNVDIPVVIKEVGAGIDGGSAKKLENMGVKSIELAGAGGTSYTAVEYYRARTMGMEDKERLGKILWNWGIPTAASLYLVKDSVKIPIISSGGMRTGIDVAKALIMGASMTALALPILRPAIESDLAVKKRLEQLIYELKAVMFLTGSKNISELKNAKYIITGELKDWLGIEKIR